MVNGNITSARAMRRPRKRCSRMNARSVPRTICRICEDRVKTSVFTNARRKMSSFNTPSRFLRPLNSAIGWATVELLTVNQSAMTKG